jgi:DNA-binding NarL/FixJ family response regulator
MTLDGTDVQIVAEADDGRQAFEKLQQYGADVALIDISMPRADGFKFLELVQQAGLALPVVMHSVHDGSEYLRRCQSLGAKGFVLKGQEKDVLLAAIRAVHAGGEFWSGPSSH